jgi:pilus assembly protein Flp/PilA
MKMNKMLNQIMRDEEGQGMVEYGLIIAGIAIACIIAIWALGPKIAALFSNVTDKITPVVPAG